MIDKVEKKCMGCSACYNACPKQAITFSCDNTFFYEPKVDYDKCISCKKCINVCPAIEYKTSNFVSPNVYAVYASDIERKKSATGAAFPIIANYILNKGGYVCGAVWDENWNVHHIIINNPEDLKRLRFSKYVQSNPNTVFTEIKKLLDADKTVLFSGTPCQNAGLQKFLGKDYPNLYSIDLLCHGVSCPKIWNDYLDENYDKSKITNICFRNKEKGWIECGNSYYDVNGSFIECDGEKKPIGVYYENFLKHKLSNDSCMTCPFRKVPRPGDFTLGDFWKYAKYDKTLNDGKGLNVLLCNNRKASLLFEEIKNDYKFFKKINLHKNWKDIELIEINRNTPERDLLFSNYSFFETTKSLDQAIGRHYDVALLSQFNGMNYGSSLVSYAVNKLLESLGYSVLMVHKPYNWDYPYDNTNMSWKFAKKHYHISRFFERDESCRELNNIVDTFIVGSDTLWWWADVSKTNYHYWLDFVEADKKKIAFCTSFAQEETDVPLEKQKQLKYLYSRFDGLSVREECGKKILKDTYGVDSECFIDPTLIAPKSVWDELASDSKLNEENYVLAYILDFTKEKEKYVKAVARQLNKRVILIGNPKFPPKTDLFIRKQYEIEDFVYLFKNADFVVTDSFHGTCFSVIYDKPFASLINSRRGLGRYSVFINMGLGNRLISDPYIFNDSLIASDVDYSNVTAFIQEKSIKSISWLRNKLTQEKNVTQNDYMYDFFKVELDNYPVIKIFRKQMIAFIKRCLRFLYKRRKYLFVVFILCLALILFLILR